MADVCDLAKAIADQHMAVMLANRKKDAAGESATHCEECGGTIPDDRRAAVKGCTRCTECQADYEEYERRSG